MSQSVQIGEYVNGLMVYGSRKTLPVAQYTFYALIYAEKGLY